MENKLTYTKVGDYYIPNLTIKPSPPIGKYGRMRRDYLRNHRPALYNRLILHEQLQKHFAEINEAIQNRLDVLIPQIAESAGVTEKLKETDQMKWVGLMNTCKAQAEEIAFSELLYIQFLKLCNA